MTEKTYTSQQEILDTGIELVKTAKEQIHRLTVIYELTKAIISVSDFDELLKQISEKTARVFNAKGCILRLLENDRLKVKAFYGLCDDPCDIIKEEISIGEGVCGKAAQEGRTIIFYKPDDLNLIMPTTKFIQAAICTPLKIGETVIGTFGLYDKKPSAEEPQETVIPFTTEDMTTLEGFASIAAIVIEKSMMYDNALKQEKETLEMKKQAEELKDYLQGLIENSADAIVTTDLNGQITSYNTVAEKMFDFSKEEVMGQFMPFIPHFLIDIERSYIEQVKRGEIIKDIETVRKTKDGRLMDVSLTLSPIKDSAGNIIGISRIGRDITEKKRIEKDLVRRNNELSRLLFISSTMRETLELDKLLRMLLTAVTMGDGFGFNRAMLFLVDEDQKTVRGAMGVGHASHEEAWEIWSRLSMEHKDIYSIMEDIEKSPLRKDSLMDRLCCGIEVSLDTDTILTKSVKEKKSFNVTDIRSEPLSDAVLIQQFGTTAYALVPLISRDRVIGVLWVDNLYSRKSITEHDIDVLKGFTDQIASAIENARLFEHIAQAEQELENIFESISDFVYFVNKDYIIKKVNRAVIDKIGLPQEEIIGKKCYQIFHGLNAPWDLCPHHKTVTTNQPFAGELEDPHLGGTFLISSSPIFDNSGFLLGTVHIARDVSEIKKLRETVASVERMAALGEMAAKVAHEIRNPLLSIGGFAKRLEKRLDRDLKEHSRIIVEEVRRLEGILNNILSFVKTAKLEKAEVELSGLIEDVVNLLEPAIHEKGNILIKEIEYPIKIHANYDKFKEAVLNIMTNANEAMEKGNIFIRAYKTSTLSETNLPGQMAEKAETVVEIEDNGSGIKEEDINRIFDPFFTTRTTGTGLGLSITKRIIEEHGGRIEVDSVIGRGTKFKIHLP